jgi:hypothetical protein
MTLSAVLVIIVATGSIGAVESGVAGVLCWCCGELTGAGPGAAAAELVSAGFWKDLGGEYEVLHHMEHPARARGAGESSRS